MEAVPEVEVAGVQGGIPLVEILRVAALEAGDPLADAEAAEEGRRAGRRELGRLNLLNRSLNHHLLNPLLAPMKCFSRRLIFQGRRLTLCRQKWHCHNFLLSLFCSAAGLNFSTLLGVRL